MAASTKSGLSGGFSGGGGPTDVQSARTLYGHDMHLRSALEAAAPVNEVHEEEQTDCVERPVTVEEEVAPASDEIIPGRTGKSRFPALARLFGRWNTQGQFEQKFYDDDLDSIPRERFLRPLAIVVATAAISFFIVVGLLRLRDSTLSQPTAAARAMPAAEVVAPAAPPPAAVVTAPPAPVRPVEAARAPTALPPPAPAPRTIELPPPTLAVKSGTLAPAKRPVARRRPRPVPFDPDGPMPLSF